MSKGNVPFPKAPGDPGLFFDYLKRGNRPKQPQNCPDSVYQTVILKCLDDDKWKRPTFSALVSKFEELLAEFPTPPPRQYSQSSRLGSWRVPVIRHDDVIMSTERSPLRPVFPEPPPPYSSVHSEFIWFFARTHFLYFFAKFSKILKNLILSKSTVNIEFSYLFSVFEIHCSTFRTFLDQPSLALSLETFSSKACESRV